jgi:hypothetical protein
MFEVLEKIYLAVAIPIPAFGKWVSTQKIPLALSIISSKFSEIFSLMNIIKCT